MQCNQESSSANNHNSAQRLAPVQFDWGWNHDLIWLIVIRYQVTPDIGIYYAEYSTCQCDKRGVRGDNDLVR